MLVASDPRSGQALAQATAARQAALRANASNARNSGYGTGSQEPRRGRDHRRVVGAQLAAAGSSARVPRARTAPPRARAARSSAATPPPIASRRCAGAARAPAPASASGDSTTARWYEAARSARRASVCVRAEVAHLVDERRLQPAEAEVERVAAAHPEREVERARVALAREAVDRGSARDSRGPSGARALSSASPAASSRVAPSSRSRRGRSTRREERVAAARDQAQEGRLDRLRLEEVRRHVAVQVVHRPRTAAARPRRAPWRSRGRPAARRSAPARW